MEGQITKFFPGLQGGLRIRMNVFFQTRDHVGEPRAICTRKECPLYAERESTSMFSDYKKHLRTIYLSDSLFSTVM
jgi:hypothetical protein